MNVNYETALNLWLKKNLHVIIYIYIYISNCRSNIYYYYYYYKKINSSITNGEYSLNHTTFGLPQTHEVFLIVAI